MARTPWDPGDPSKDADGGIRLSEHNGGADGEVAFRHAYATGLEGIVAKRRDRPYVSGRWAAWIRVKNPDAPAVMRQIEE